ncbi:MAG: hypothetical protein RLY93_17575 [Sumerlaeia bacterium]
MIVKTPWFLPLLCALTVGLLPARLPALYQIHSWENFEQGLFPAALNLGHNANNSNVLIRSFDSFGQANPITARQAALECGKFGLLMAPSSGTPHLSATLDTTMDRSRLGERGQALYQADFYLPAEGEPTPFVALLARQPMEGSNYAMYRFGIQNERVFFSYADGVEPNPQIFLQQPVAQFPIQRPGWNRLQIIFQGPDTIYCAINRQMSNFSPIRDAGLTKLAAGVMVTVPSDIEPGDAPPPVLVDNLSVQWTPTESPLPDSPWIRPTVQEASTGSPFDPATIFWYEDPNSAWQASRRDRRPMLILFYMPRLEPVKYLEHLALQDPAAAAQLQNYVLLRIDANQLHGSRLSQKFEIYRIPTMLILGSDGKEQRRLTVIPNATSWADVQKFLDPTPNVGG